MKQFQFDKYGNLEPHEILIISKEAFYYHFVRCFDDVSSARSELYELYEQFSKDFSEQYTDEFVHWINGSFTTNKDNPNDIDFIKNDIKQLQDLVTTAKRLLQQFPTDTIMANTLAQYEQRLKIARQSLRKVKKKEVEVSL